MKRLGLGGQFLASVMCLFVSACAMSRTGEDTVFVDSSRGAVLLQHVDDAWFTTAHPISVNPLLLTHVLSGVQVQPSPDDQSTVQVFSDEEVAFLSPLMSTALSKSTKNQLVAFRVTHDSGPSSELTGGLLFTRGRLLHLWLTHYRANGARNDSGATQDRQARNPQGLAPHQLHFVPETVQQPSHNQQPDVIDPPPFATLVIDYRHLASHVSLQAEAPSPLPSEPQAARPEPSPVGAQGTASSGAEETQALKEVVKEQARELDALKDDMRALRQRLFEMDAGSTTIQPGTTPRGKTPP
ncbi:MAG: hypothetical protein U0236_12310 [Nitrospira sp.]